VAHGTGSNSTQATGARTLATEATQMVAFKNTMIITEMKVLIH
jgi:hypothetical protein